jgi:hypothetical protein
MFQYSPGGQLAVKMTGELAEPSLSTVEAAPMAAAAIAAATSSPRITVHTARRWMLGVICCTWRRYSPRTPTD